MLIKNQKSILTFIRTNKHTRIARKIQGRKNSVRGLGLALT